MKEKISAACFCIEKSRIFAASKPMNGSVVQFG